MNENKNYRNIIIGAGPAGLAAGYELAKTGQEVLIIEAENEVGGLCQTIDFQGFKFDFGGHRFFTKNEEVNKFWHEILGEDFLERPRLSRIYYQRKFFAYPIKIFDALPKLGIWEAIRVGLSLLGIKIKNLFKKAKEITFEDWVVNRFGRRLFNHFFKSYTEKMWGVSVKELGADWAAQRMKDMSLWQVIKSFVFGSKEGEVKSMIDKFEYPKYGPGQLFKEVAKKIEENGGEIRLGVKLKQMVVSGEKIEKIVLEGKNGEVFDLTGENYISSVPLDEILKAIQPILPPDILALVKKMRFRSFFDVCLVVNKKDVFPDNWIYVHEPEVRLLRVQNFKNWSPFMTPDDNRTPIGAEYVCWDTEEVWEMSDADLVKMAADELEKVGLLSKNLVAGGTVIRNKYAYPVYHLDYKEDLTQIFSYLKKIKNFQTIGRSGLYRYNNMDHSILTGFYAARNVMGGNYNVMGGNYNVLDVNADEEYHEVKK